MHELVVMPKYRDCEYVTLQNKINRFESVGLMSTFYTIIFFSNNINITLTICTIYFLDDYLGTPNE